ncbi:gluconate 2-dehydrogenase subunit 3 family protein [Sediminibacterium goheungense]|uniref:Gluconate 2-dehydrogenase subunit 3-like protein n=1 Tax=Sediminibacterium goheungense TaxID=1086393 RepID=A0A4R6IUU2_9BACT|nr:gluconate 2-dehydrogenase subunit 3 family protein [Sediminibacterium goheungense]TDO26390.1 gluconate 2-dehydrogenase subunit 3-like protein [Sediminibacterium goheungense]
MNRREALSSVALLLGGTLIGSTAFLTGCKTSGTDSGISFSPEEISFLNEVGETILPATSTPGAKEAKVGEFMSVYVADCYEAKDQVIFKEGFKKLDEASKKKHNKTFLESSPEERHALLVDLDKEVKEYQKTKKEEDPNHYFRMMKELTLMGFFTSEVGATKALRYVAVPGKYEGCIPYNKGDKAWAT